MLPLALTLSLPFSLLCSASGMPIHSPFLVFPVLLVLVSLSRHFAVLCLDFACIFFWVFFYAFLSGLLLAKMGGVGAAFLFKFIQFICPKNMQTFCPHIRIFLRTVSVHFWLFFCPCSLPLSRSLSPSMLSIHFWHILCALSVVCPCHLWVQLRHNLCSTTFLWLWPVLP